MTSWNSKLFTLAATLAIAAGTASAQVVLRASIPFAFEVSGGHSLAAGKYDIQRDATYWRFVNNETRGSAILPTVVHTHGRDTDAPRLVFECRGNRCELRNIQAGAGESGAYFPPRKRSKSDTDELARTVIVPLNAAD